MITVIDGDGDPTDSSNKKIDIPALSGKAFDVFIECEPNYTYGFRFE